MRRRILLRVVLSCMVIVGILLCADVAYLLRGSLELFPTEEQQSSIRIVTTRLAVLLAALEVVLWIAYRRLARNEESVASGGG